MELLRKVARWMRGNGLEAPVDFVAQHAPRALLNRVTVQGYIDELSTQHVKGWMRDLAAPGERLEYEVAIEDDGGSRVLLRGVADQADPHLVQLGIGDGRHAFHVLLPAPVTEAERDRLVVRAVGDNRPLERSPHLKDRFQPIHFVAMDIVDNCNLRCPFCLYDYSSVHRTNIMPEATYEAALKLLPYVRESDLWLSCLHEPALHPDLTRFIQKIPSAYRSRVRYTTNLAKRMPAEYFETLANSGLNFLNISIESLDPAVYERMRKGARHKIFLQNWEALLNAFRVGSNPPKLFYIIMAYRSNLKEIPGLVKELRENRLASNINVRYTFPVGHTAASFRDSEFLDDADWQWLRSELSIYPPEEVVLWIPPPLAAREAMEAARAAAAAGPEAAPAPGMEEPPPGAIPELGIVEMHLSWDGSLVVRPSYCRGATDIEVAGGALATVNVAEISDVGGFLRDIITRQEAASRLH